MADDKTLISHVQNGDEQAFSDLVKSYHAFVYAIVIGIMKDTHDAEEVVQDVFFNAYRGLAQLEDAAKFKGWLAEKILFAKAAGFLNSWNPCRCTYPTTEPHRKSF